MVVLFIASKLLAIYLNRIFDFSLAPGGKYISRIERLIYRMAGVHPEEEQNWVKYAKNILALSFVSFMITFIILRCQGYLPLNPQHFAGLPADLAWNTAVSFITNTNWQNYVAEKSLSYFSQMVGLVLPNFFSAAIGICSAVAVIRGIASRGTTSLGNFWVDFFRCNMYLLLPLAFINAIFLVSQGVIQSWSPYEEITTLEGIKQVIPLGPVASQVAIKVLGTNGGGFFNANSAHPFENPTALSNLIEMFSMFLIPSSLVFLLGLKTNNPDHSRSVWIAMAFLFVVGVLVVSHYEYLGNPSFSKYGAQSSVNMEGKEVRFGIFNSAMFAASTTATSCGAVNSMHDSFTPLGGLVLLFNMELGEIIFGGVGSGLYGMILFIILTVFISGLMVGRTPEYLGKKIEGKEVKYAMFTLIISVLLILGFTAWAVIYPAGIMAIWNRGPHGLSELLYAFSSAAANNGSAFAGLVTSTFAWNFILGIVMFAGRFYMLIPLLALAGSLSNKAIHPISESSFPVSGTLFTILLISVIIIIGALTYLPVLSLGPISEHFEMVAGKLF